MNNYDGNVGTRNKMPVKQETRHRRWNLIGHTLRKPDYRVARQAMAAKIKRTDAEYLAKARLTEDRNAWQNYVGGLCPNEDDNID